jgi:hypothetical protein
MINVARLPDSRAGATPEPRPVFPYADLAIGHRLREVFNSEAPIPDETWRVVGVAIGISKRFRRIGGYAPEEGGDWVELENETTRERITRQARTLRYAARWQVLPP